MPLTELWAIADNDCVALNSTTTWGLAIKPCHLNTREFLYFDTHVEGHLINYYNSNGQF